MPAKESAAIEQDDRRYNHTKMFGTKAKDEKGDPTDVCAGDSGDFFWFFLAGRWGPSQKRRANPIQAVLSSGKVWLPVLFLLGLYKEVASTAGSGIA